MLLLLLKAAISLAFIGLCLFVLTVLEPDPVPPAPELATELEPVVDLVDEGEVEPEEPRALTVKELRDLCTQRSIKWRNLHGKNKHMSKAEMLIALDA